MNRQHHSPSLFRYAVLGVPLGCIGLPLYVHLPKYYKDTMPLSLETIGLVLLLTRLIDCLADPCIGYALYRYQRYTAQIRVCASALLGLGVMGLFYLPALGLASPLVPLVLLLLVTYIAYSIVTIVFYSDGIALASPICSSVTISAFREALIVFGVMLASIVPVFLAVYYHGGEAYRFFALIFVLLLALGSVLYRAPVAHVHVSSSFWQKLRSSRQLSWIFLLYFVNALAPSVTSTLFLFYTADILQRPDMSGVLLGGYFMSAIAFMPMWLRLADYLGKRMCLLLSFSLALGSFVLTLMLGAGDVAQFFLICVVSGAALGGDLVVLPSLLSDALDVNDPNGALEFGIWNFISKFTLALAAGITLPLLGNASAADYSQVLHMSYAVIPCFFKLMALAILFFSPIDRSKST